MNITSSFINYKLWETIKIQLYGRKELKNCTGRLSGNNLKSANAYAKTVVDARRVRDLFALVVCVCMSGFFFREWKRTQTISFYHWLGDWCQVLSSMGWQIWTDGFPRADNRSADAIVAASTRKWVNIEFTLADNPITFRSVCFCSSFRLIKSIWKWLHMHTK